MRVAISILVTGLVLVVAACSVTVEGSETTTTAPATTRATLPGLEPLILAPDGLGAVAFGANMLNVVEDLTSRLGAPDRDSGWQSPDGLYGNCPGVAVRAVGFGSFEVLFTDAGADRLPEFFAWAYGFDLATTTAGVDPRGLDLRTVKDVGLGSTRTDLQAAYGPRLVNMSNNVGAGWGFRIDPGEAMGIRGLLDGANPDSVVTFMESAPGCGS